MQNQQSKAHALDTTGENIAVEGLNSVLEFAFAESFADLENLETDWNDLDRASGRRENVFQTYPWCWQWANQCAKGENSSWRLKILTGRKSGKLVLVLPLAIPCGGLINEARWLGEPLTQYGDVLVADDPAREVWVLEAWKQVLEQSDIDLLHLRKVRGDALIYPLLHEHTFKLPGSAGAPCLDLTVYKNFDEFNASFPSKKRRDRRRKRRRLAELGELKFEMLSPGLKAEKALVTALEFKNAWLKKSGLRNSAFNNEETVNSLRSMIRGEGAQVDCLISTLHLDNETLAVEIGFVNCNGYFSHIGAYNPWFYVYSPGKILHEDTIRELIVRGFESYDLMAPADEYKLQWTNSVMDTFDHAMPISLRGVTHMALYLKLIRPGMKSLFQKMPEVIRRKAVNLA